MVKNEEVERNPKGKRGVEKEELLERLHRKSGNGSRKEPVANRYAEFSGRSKLARIYRRAVQSGRGTSPSFIHGRTYVQSSIGHPIGSEIRFRCGNVCSEAQNTFLLVNLFFISSRRVVLTEVPWRL